MGTAKYGAQQLDDMQSSSAEHSPSPLLPEEEEEGDDALCDYEKARLKRIHQNLLRLSSLGLPASLAAVPVTHEKRKQPRTFSTRPFDERYVSMPSSPQPQYHTRSGCTYGGAVPTGNRSSSGTAKHDETRRCGTPQTTAITKSRRGSSCPPPEPHCYSHEYYTQSHLDALGSCITPYNWLKDRRVYDTRGTTCHQCRQKTLDKKTECTRCLSGRGKLCGMCLQLRYGENLDEVLAKLQRGEEWVCPCCRDLCNCSNCRHKKQWPPTGILAPRVSDYPSVAHYLVHTYLVQDDAQALLSHATKEEVTAKVEQDKESKRVEVVEVEEDGEQKQPVGKEAIQRDHEDEGTETDETTRAESRDDEEGGELGMAVDYQIGASTESDSETSLMEQEIKRASKRQRTDSWGRCTTATNTSASSSCSSSCSSSSSSASYFDDVPATLLPAKRTRRSRRGRRCSTPADAFPHRTADHSEDGDEERRQHEEAAEEPHDQSNEQKQGQRGADQERGKDEEGKRKQQRGEEDDDEETYYEVERIIAHRCVGGGTKLQYRVRWKGYAPESDTWEPEDSLADTCDEEIDDYWRQSIGGLAAKETLHRRMESNIAKMRSRKLAKESRRPGRGARS